MNQFWKRVVTGLGIFAIVATLALPLTKTTAAARDCDDNAIVKCGALDTNELKNKLNNGDTVHSAANIQSIYQGFGINVTNASIDQAVSGSVTKSGQVIVNGQVVATNVWTAGRKFIPNSEPVAGVWMRPPAVSFLSPSLDAFVYAPGGVFQWAILKSCGNPVKSIAKPFPVIYKHVLDTQQPGTSYAADDNAHALAVNSGTTIKYEITVVNGGTAPMTNTVMTDNLPAGVEKIANPSERSSTANLGTLQPGESQVYTIGLTQGLRVTANQAGQFIDNMACVNATGVTQVCDHAVITIKNGGGGGGNQPAFDCTGLTVVKVPASQANGNELTYEFFAAASTTNTQVTGYHWNFGDGTTKDTPATESRTKHTYAAAKPNTTATVQVKTPLGTTPVKTICSATFDVKPTNSAMAYDCVNITSSPVGTKDSLTHRFVATTSFSGTTITGYRWTFPGNVVKDTTTNTIDHTFPAKGNYEVSVAVKDASGVYKTSAACKKTFTVGPGNEQPPCVDCGGGELPKEELPNTGMEGAAAGALGTGVLGYSVHAYRRSKRALVDALRNVSVGSNDR